MSCKNIVDALIVVKVNIMTEEKKLLSIAFIGAPNAGKSTLTNFLVGEKVSIVTPKVQTTRTRITGILSRGHTQLVLLDCPGIFRPKKPIDRGMVDSAWQSAMEADINMLIVDGGRIVTPNVRGIISQFDRRQAGDICLIINKVDRVKKTRLPALVAEYNDLFPFERSFMISALTGDGVSDVEQYMLSRAIPGPWMFEGDEVSDMPSRLFAAEITREKLMLRLHQEIPYELMVQTESFVQAKTPKGNDIITIHQTIIVATESQKKIVVGKGGANIRDIGTAARMELREIFGCNIYLELFVKTVPGWQSKRGLF